jgi:hypothetical protein
MDKILKHNIHTVVKSGYMICQVKRGEANARISQWYTLVKLIFGVLGRRVARDN